MHCHLLPWGLDMWRTCTVYKPSSAERGCQFDRCHFEGITNLWCVSDNIPGIQPVLVWIKFVVNFSHITERLWFKNSLWDSCWMFCEVPRRDHHGSFPTGGCTLAILSLSIPGPSPEAKWHSSGGWAAPRASRTSATCWWGWQESWISCPGLLSLTGRDLTAPS